MFIFFVAFFCFVFPHPFYGFRHSSPPELRSVTEQQPRARTAGTARDADAADCPAVANRNARTGATKKRTNQSEDQRMGGVFCHSEERGVALQTSEACCIQMLKEIFRLAPNFHSS